MSVEEAEAGKSGRECESETEIFFCFVIYLFFSLNVPSWADVSTNIFHFYSLYNY